MCLVGNASIYTHIAQKVKFVNTALLDLTIHPNLAGGEFSLEKILLKVRVKT